ncbi:hypothetical protein [Pandoraea soli]|uniref:hypothetical protein n=1 Tax=Pandoraea soli TaxID=2508293 RepID=UPI0012422037|nr:hypothetical protein [Pandoraea soli]
MQADSGDGKSGHYAFDVRNCALSIAFIHRLEQKRRSPDDERRASNAASDGPSSAALRLEITG